MVDILMLIMWHMEVFTLMFIVRTLFDFSDYSYSIFGLFMLSFFYASVKGFELAFFKITTMKGEGLVGLTYSVASLLIMIASAYLISELYKYLTKRYKFGGFYVFLKIKLSKNYTKEHRDTILKLGHVLIKSGEFEEIENLKIKDVMERNSFDDPWSYPIRWETVQESQSVYDRNRGNLMQSIVKFFNTIVGYSDKKDNANLVETTLLKKENIQILAFILNVFEDKEKTKFILSADGKMQRDVLTRDVANLNKQVEKSVEEIKDLARKTYKNKMNSELNALRQNRFDKIEEMKK